MAKHCLAKHCTAKSVARWWSLRRMTTPPSWRPPPPPPRGSPLHPPLVKQVSCYSDSVVARFGASGRLAISSTYANVDQQGCSGDGRVPAPRYELESTLGCVSLYPVRVYEGSGGHGGQGGAGRGTKARKDSVRATVEYRPRSSRVKPFTDFPSRHRQYPFRGVTFEPPRQGPRSVISSSSYPVLPYYPTLRGLPTSLQAYWSGWYKEGLMCFASSIPQSRLSTEIISDKLYCSSNFSMLADFCPRTSYQSMLSLSLSYSGHFPPSPSNLDSSNLHIYHQTSHRLQSRTSNETPGDGTERNGCIADTQPRGRA